MSAAHVTRALEAELLAPHVADGRAEAAAFAACTTLAFIASSYAVPIAGPVVVASSIAAFAPSFRDRAASKAQGEHKVPPQVEDALDRELSAHVLPGQPEDPRVKAWGAFLPWDELCAGKKVEVPRELAHPSCVGFEYTRLASRVGQSCDWACPLADGSRLHAHEFPDGHVVVHRDALDPNHGVGTAVIHYLSEAREGQIITGLLAVGFLAAGFALVNKGML